MKKKLLILAMCLFGALSANAATWVAIDSGNPNIQMFIDSDSIKYSSVDTCTYALLYKKGDEQTKVIYAKSNFSKDTAGIIEVEDFEPDDYAPGYYSKHTRAFMKDIQLNAILRSAHNFALAMYHEKASEYTPTGMDITNIKNVSDYLKTNNRFGFSDEEYFAYVDVVKSSIYKNWKPTLSTVYTDVVLLVSINSDGSYNGYRILDSSSSDKAKRAAITAVNLSAPFAPFPEGSSATNTLNIPITFEQKLFRKSIK